MKKLLYILLFIPIALFGQEPVSYNLSSGWNMVGYTGCEITPIEEAFQDALGNGSSLEETFNIIKDVRGRMWHPALGENSLLTHLTPGEGYMMLVNYYATVSFSEEYCNDITYQLNSGWNMVAFTGDVDSERNIVTALDVALENGAGTANTFQLIKNINGQFWSAAFAQISSFTPGEAYMMFVNGQETTVSFTENSTQVFENNPGVEFTLPASDNNMSVIFPAGALNDFVGYEIYVQSDFENVSENHMINEDGSVGIAVIGFSHNIDMNLANPGDLLYFTITSPDGTLINLDLDQPLTYLSWGRYLVSEPLGFSIDGNPVVLGCTDDVYLEFITSANLDDGSCATLIVEGCMDESSCSYFDQANVDNGSCIYETEQSLFNTCCLDNLVTSICPSEENCATTDIDCVNLGCMSSWADNFDVFVNEDDGSCYKMGCTEDWADNYDNVSTENDGSCYKMGCTEDWADNYDNVSTENDGSCYKMGCTEDWADNYDNISTENDGSCYKMGCTEDWADNYDELATAYNDSCSLESCTSTWADNYDSNATIDDGSCYKLGCTNLLALNYDEFVTNDDGSCDYEIVTQLSLSFDAWNISIDLQQGWNMFGYACPTPIDIVEGLSNDTDKVSLVKDNGGNAYVPEFNFNGIGNLIPGFGYQIKIREAIAGFNLCADYINTVMINDLESILQELSSNSDSLLQMNNNIVSMQEEIQNLQELIDSLSPSLGCIDETAFNYNPSANTDDGSCMYPIGGIEFELNQGWNMVGFTGCEITPIEDALGNGSSLEETFNIIKDVRGRMWHPALGENSLLTHLTPGEGYLMFVNDYSTVSFSEEYCNDITYQLNSGWNMVGYTGDTEQNITEFLTDNDLLSQFVIIKDISGKLWTPDVSLLQKFVPGEAYMMFVNGQETTVSFTGNSTQVFENNPGVEFTLPASDHNMSVIFPAGVLNDFVGYEIYIKAKHYDYSTPADQYNGVGPSSIYESIVSENHMINDDGSVGIAVIGFSDYIDINLAYWQDSLQFYITSPDGTLINLDLDQPITYLSNVRYLVSEPLGFLIDGEQVVFGCTDSEANNYNELATLDNGSCDVNLSIALGDLAEGGIVFYVDETGEHGLVAAMEDLTEGATDPYGLGFNGYDWGCFFENVSGADGQAIGIGYQNTMDIVSQGCVTENGGITAAQVALDTEVNGYSDWYLPSIDELNEMYNTIGPGGLESNIGGFEISVNSYYWSSSEINHMTAWGVYFDNGDVELSSKNNTRSVRVIRSF